MFNISAIIRKGQSWPSNRITYYDGKIVRFSYKDYTEGGKTSFMTLKVHTFIGRLIRHIPDKDFPMIRYAGLFSNRWKQHYLGQARDALNQSAPDDSDEDTQPTWAERQTDYTGIDPLICPNCDKPLTFVGSFFGNWNELKYLFDIAGKDSTIVLLLYCDQDDNHVDTIQKDPLPMYILW
ncbi:MAG: transposase [Deltaproteobacteria bacterium]|nr:transposase [Deltaproteobacteria bacterium]